MSTNRSARTEEISILIQSFNLEMIIMHKATCKTSEKHSENYCYDAEKRKLNKKKKKKEDPLKSVSQSEDEDNGYVSTSQSDLASSSDSYLELLETNSSAHPLVSHYHPI